MNSIEIKAEIEKLEAEAKQILANANFVNGAIQAMHKVLSLLEIKSEVKDNEPKTPNGPPNP